MERTMDKAVSTEDLLVGQAPVCLEAARLEAIFRTLVENKVEAIKNCDRKASSLHSSPKSFVNRLGITSSSSVASSRSEQKQRRRRRRDDDEDGGVGDVKRARRAGRSKNRVSSSSPESPRYRMHRCCEERKGPPFVDESIHEALEFLHCDSVEDHHHHHHQERRPNCPGCCQLNQKNGQIRMQYSDYVSLKIEDDEDAAAVMLERREAAMLRRARRKRRKRRRKRFKTQLAAMPLPPEEEEVKVLDPEELPQRARWTIVATACLLLFMCLLLVGVTLRMAPIIDDMVRKENEELMNSLHREPSGHHHGYHGNSTHSSQARP